MLAYFVSDLHLSRPDDLNAEIFLRFLKRIRDEVVGGAGRKKVHLFLVGDVFDLWIGQHEFFVRRFEPVVKAIGELVAIGVKVHYFEGNHDLYLTEYWQRTLGVQVHANAEYFDLEGTSLRVEHGDLINENDRGYLFLRGFLRSRPMTAIEKFLPGFVIQAIGESASKISRRHTAGHSEHADGSIRQMIRKHAQRVYHERPFDFLVTGHVHVMDDFSFEESGRSVRSVNLGSWHSKPRAFRLENQEGRFIDLDGVVAP